MSKTTNLSLMPALKLAIRLCLILLLALPLLGVIVAPRQAYAQTKQFHYDRYDADITVNQDGSIDVVETLVYVYDEGDFHRGSRAIPTDRADGISNVAVVEELPGGGTQQYRETTYDPDDSTSGVPGTFGTLQDGNQLRVRWVFNYVSNTTKTFKLSYHAAGVVRVYDNRDELDWYALPQDPGATINASRVQVTLPQGTDTSNYTTASSISAAEVSKRGNTVTWTATSGLDSGIEIGVQIPKGVLSPSAPSWQAGVDQQEKLRPLFGIGSLLLSLLVLVVGLIWVIRRWYTRGRDKPVALYSDYITEPPSNLPPGLVGTLLDESADVRDVIATVVDMGRKRNLLMQETDRGGLFSSKDFEYTKTGNNVDWTFEGMVMNALFNGGNAVRLSSLKNNFYKDLPAIYEQMYSELVRVGLFPENPQSVRVRNYAGGIGLLVLAGLALAAAFVLGSSIGYMIFALPFAIGIVGIAWLVTAGAMPRKTDKGSDEAAKWRAFGRYLQDMQRYTNVQAAADKFQQYLPYAVAMGLDRDLIRQFENVPAAMPPYYAPYGYNPVFIPYPVGGGGYGSGGSIAGQGGPVGGPVGGPAPQFDPGAAMQGMSNSLAGAMQSMSDSFTQMVNSASNVLTSSPQSSSSGGGGWGGGGGGFGGGGGGGGSAGAD